MKIKQLFLLSIALILVLSSCTIKNGDSVVISSDGSSAYSIVVSNEASDSVLKLATELSEISDSKLPIFIDTESSKKEEIIIGATDRALVKQYIDELDKIQSKNEYHYLICEKDGKVIIIADNDACYEYAIDRIKNTYIQDGNLIIPNDCHDLQIVTMQQYYSSEYYLNQAWRENEENRYWDEKDQLADELNRYEDKESESTMTVKEAIEHYKKLAASFKSSDFGSYDATAFVSAMKSDSPEVYPGASHPRVMFTTNSLDKIRQNLTATENEYAYSTYMAYSDVPTDGKFKTLADNSTHNYDINVVTYIESKAFRYAMTGDKIYGYQAIYCIKNSILSLNIPAGTLGDSTRAWGRVLCAAGCVYDWCYDLMTEEDKKQIINGCITLLGVHMEVVWKDGIANNIVPSSQGPVYGHGGETQLLRDWLTFAIACYDEAPEVYEYVAGRLFDDYKDSQNYFFASQSHWEGAAYGPGRLLCTMYGNFLINRMTDGNVNLFSDDIEEVAITLLHYDRPDGQPLRIGDVYHETNSSLNLSTGLALFTGNYYNNSTLKAYAWNALDEFKTLSWDGGSLSPVWMLLINDPSVSHTDTKGLDLTRLTKYPYTSLFAKNAKDDVNAFMVYMTMPEAYGASHGHMDCGSFQIYYKGILASDSGKYSTWGDYHHMAYSMQTVSSNSLLIYNPNLKDTKNSKNQNMVYSGGQSIAGDRGNIPNTFEEILSTNVKPQCISLGAANVEKDGVYLYSYMGGDMTGAYDAETVDEVTRYMFAVATGDPNNPLVFVTYDRITSDDASYRKSALIHVQQEPTLTNDGFVIITNTKNGNNGKLVVQNVMENVEYTIIGGDGKQFWLGDNLGNASTDTTVSANSIAEYGWGRLEISPKNPELTNSMLTVMYVTDADNNSAPIKAVDLSSGNLAGTMILGKAMFFPKNEKLLTEEATITLGAKADCYISGISAGEWVIYNGNTAVETVTVEDGTNLLTFTANAGTYTIKPAN